MTGDGPTPRERKRKRVTCGDFEKEMVTRSLDSHRMTQHGKSRGKEMGMDGRGHGRGRRGRASNV